MIITVDGGGGGGGGGDENPRYSNTIWCAIDYFVSEGLNALFIATNAPGRSAFNRYERRMAPFSKELSGVILDHEHFGSHLDNQGNTIDPELELKNFEYAGEIRSEIWSKLVIDGHPVVAEYIKDNSPHSPMQKSEDWKVEHIRESQYFLQIVKCLDSNCCSPFRSSYFTRFTQQRDETEAPERIRPIRVAAKRQGEYLCGLAFQELEWHEIDYIVVNGLQVPDDYIITSGTPVIEDITSEVQELNK